MNLERNEVREILLRHLKEHPVNNLNSIQAYFFQLLEKRGLVGTFQRGSVTISGEQMLNGDIMLINEVVYDLIVERILTPGRGNHELGMPHVTVTNKAKLDKEISKFD